MEFEYLIDDKPVMVKIEKKDGRILAASEGKEIEIDMVRVSPEVISFMIKGSSYRIFLARDGETRHFSLNGLQFIVREDKETDQDFSGGEEKSKEEMLAIKAPMPGKVIKICVKEKEAIRKNQTLVIVEAMKMENEIKSAIDGSVKSICAKPGDLVDSDKILIELETKES